MRTSDYSAASFVSIFDSDRLELLRKQLRYAAANSAFYSYLSPDSVRSFDDLCRLPFTTAEDIKQHGARMVCVPASRIERIVSLLSSGTSDRPKRLFFTSGDLERTVGFFREGMGWMCSPGDRAAILLPCSSPHGVGQLLKAGLERLGAVPLCIGVIAGPEDVEKAASAAPDVIVGMPWQVRLLALVHPELRPRSVLLSADYVPEVSRGFLEEIWTGCAVLCHFGMTETGYGCAVESPEHTGMFLRRDELFAEIIDPDTGERLPAGKTGELVLTTLRREAMPLIRYRTGDLARLTPSGDLDRVFGRIASDNRIYALQEALFPVRWLWDYRFDGGITAAVAEDAPNNCAELIAAAAERAGYHAARVDISRVTREQAAPMYRDKRM